MKQIIYDIIDNIDNYNKSSTNENNSANSDITISPPLSTKGGSNNSNKDFLCKKILFNVEKNYNIFINNNENKNLNNINKNNNNKKKLFISKKRKRIFSILKIQRKNNESTKNIIKKINIFKQNFPKHKENNKNDEKIIIDILLDKNNNNKNNNNNIKLPNNNEPINKNNNKTCNDNINKNINIDNKDKEENKETNKEDNKKTKKKKNRDMSEKELQLMYEQKFLENINKNYSDEDYEKDMKECLNDKRMKFMKDNFPIMFQKDKFYLYSILPKKRQGTKDYFIEPNYFNKKIGENLYNYYDVLYNDFDISFGEKTKEINYNKNINLNNKTINKYNENICKNDLKENNENESDNIYINKENISMNISINNNKKIKIFNIFKTKKLLKNKNNIILKNNINIINNNLIIKEKNSLLPRKVWSLENNNINLKKFFDECIQIWPFDECCFIKEIGLEFLMKNNYNINFCLKKIDEFVYFMKKRAQELDFPIISQSIKTIKRYNLRKTNFN